jgi:hypothetical protein
MVGSGQPESPLYRRYGSNQSNSGNGRESVFPVVLLAMEPQYLGLEDITLHTDNKTKKNCVT